MPNRKKINQFNIDGEFIKEWDSITEASIGLSLFHGNIINVCKGVKASTGRFLFEYSVE